MFRHSGAKLKAWAILLAVLGILGGIVFAIWYFISLSDGSGLMVRLGLVTLVGYFLSLWLSLLILYALGDASDNTALILEKLEKLEARERARAAAAPSTDRDTPAGMLDPEALKAVLYYGSGQDKPGSDLLS